jgi:hypothetical protein
MMLVLLVATMVMVSTASAQDKEKKGRKGGDRPTPEKRFDDMEKTVKHDPLTGVLTKDEYVKALKDTRMADRAEEMFKRIKKADENKVTKAEYVTAMKEMFTKGKGKGKKTE